MPSAIAPVLGIVGNLIGANVTNKANQQAATSAGDASRQYAQQSLDQARTNEQQAVQSAMQELQKWFAGNPGPAAGLRGALPPPGSAGGQGPSFGGGTIGAIPPAAPPPNSLSAVLGGGARYQLPGALRGAVAPTAPPQATTGVQAPQSGQQHLALQNILARLSGRVPQAPVQ